MKPKLLHKNINQLTIKFWTINFSLSKNEKKTKNAKKVKENEKTRMFSAYKTSSIQMDVVRNDFMMTRWQQRAR